MYKKNNFPEIYFPQIGNFPEIYFRQIMYFPEMFIDKKEDAPQIGVHPLDGFPGGIGPRLSRR